MLEVKKTLFYMFFLIEMAIFIFFYAFGTHGIEALRHLDEENNLIRQENSKIKEDISRLEQESAAYEHTSFYKEKIARERLQMARKDDIVYYL